MNAHPNRANRITCRLMALIPSFVSTRAIDIVHLNQLFAIDNSKIPPLTINHLYFKKNRKLDLRGSL
jgi:hypothetical protein